MSIRDSNKWVKAEAYKQLGSFIETLRGGTKLSDKLLDEYCKMLTPEVKEYFAAENEVFFSSWNTLIFRLWKYALIIFQLS